ncbi:MAG: hypothetical protein ING80_07260 [Rhodocyclaceae bacterium]|jgi:hypothetical protein|nr:hypothetical protein [Rhodocyclaceae bacterium]MCA3141998.1 hypothetical protein [Rhodocyclaceae bacterium]MCA3144907.1 hypothetical protein [Rhodocyclaceae bacterium]MCE2899261.1 hypothetical protein [Betaproteobacteria bacterium]
MLSEDVLELSAVNITSSGVSPEHDVFGVELSPPDTSIAAKHAELVKHCERLLVSRGINPNAGMGLGRTNEAIQFGHEQQQRWGAKSLGARHVDPDRSCLTSQCDA